MRRPSRIRRIAILLMILSLFAQNVHCGLLPDPLPDPDGKPADMTQKVKVFILLGQSNMLGSGRISSLENAVKQKNKYPYLVDDDGKWTVRKDVRHVFVMCSGNKPAATKINEWMTITGRNVGPEIGIGHYLGYAAGGPVLILKSCIGNRSLSWDLLPPGSEAYEADGKLHPGYRGTPDDPKGDTGGSMAKGWYAGCQYDGDIAAAKKVLADLKTYYPDATGYEVAGFFFWQGDKDRYNAVHASRYEKNLVQFIKALRKDFDVPGAAFVCATLGQTDKNAGGNEGMILKGQMAVDGKSGKYPEFEGNVATVYSKPLCHGGGSSSHYGGHAETYMDVGEAMGKAMVELLVAAKKREMQAVAEQKPKEPEKVEARTMSDANSRLLGQELLSELVKLSDAGKLKRNPIPVPIRGGKMSLKEASSDGTMLFLMIKVRTSTELNWEDLDNKDRANLAVLVTKLRPDDKGGYARAGAYIESLGALTAAKNFYRKADMESYKKYSKFLD